MYMIKKHLFSTEYKNVKKIIFKLFDCFPIVNNSTNSKRNAINFIVTVDKIFTNTYLTALSNVNCELYFIKWYNILLVKCFDCKFGVTYL